MEVSGGRGHILNKSGLKNNDLVTGQQNQVCTCCVGGFPVAVKRIRHKHKRTLGRGVQGECPLPIFSLSKSRIILATGLNRDKNRNIFKTIMWGGGRKAKKKTEKPAF